MGEGNKRYKKKKGVLVVKFIPPQLLPTCFGARCTTRFRSHPVTENAKRSGKGREDVVLAIAWLERAHTL